MTDRSPLRQLLDETIAAEGGSMKDLTVLSPAKDPFRLDTAVNHQNGKWFADAFAMLNLGRQIHLRGAHYKIAMLPNPPVMPNGQPYINSPKNWEWFSEKAAKAARWLGYLPFEVFFDKKSQVPVVRPYTPLDTYPYVSVGVEVDIPDADELVPTAEVAGFEGTQPYKIVLFGEKSELDYTLAPIAQQYKADLYLAAGEIGDTLIHQIAKAGAEDGRPMVVFTFSDADPSGWQMPISIARKLQGFKALLYPDLDFELRRVACTPEQSKAYRLPSTPLTEKEKRADKWRAAMGIDQTEIDAFEGTPELSRIFRQIIKDAIDPFYDWTLDRRVTEAESRWRDQAQAALDEQVDGEQLARVKREAEVKLAAMRLDTDGWSLPAVPPIPSALLGVHPDGDPLVSSKWSFRDQCNRLKSSKAYDDEDES